MSVTVAKLTKIIEISHERAHEIAASLAEKIKYETSAMLIFSGVSVEFGAIYVVIAPLGHSLLLPFAIHVA